MILRELDGRKLKWAERWWKRPRKPKPGENYNYFGPIMVPIIFPLLILTVIITLGTLRTNSKKPVIQTPQATQTRHAPEEKIYPPGLFSGSNSDTKKEGIAAEKLTEKEFRQAVLDGRIQQIPVRVQYDERIKPHISTIQGWIDNKTPFKIEALTTVYEKDLDAFLKENNVNIEYLKTIPQTSSGGFNVFRLILIGSAIFFIMRLIGNRSGGMGALANFTKHKRKLYKPGTVKVGFNDIAGCNEVKEEAMQIIEFLKNPEKFNKLGGKMPMGYLFVGHPGTGKTLIAKAIAGEAYVSFLSMSGSEFVEMLVGVGAARVRDLFEEARKIAPCIIFIDEIDSISKRGFGFAQGGHDETGQTVNQLLAELDGFEKNPGIILLAATNQPDKVDEALLRPGRIDRKIVINLPDLNGRKAILEVHVRDKKISPNVNLELIAKRTPGFTGADLANIANEAAIQAAMLNKNDIGQENLEWAINRVIMGQEQKGRIITPEEKIIISYHETGHALVAETLFDNVHGVSIIPTGMGALGHTLQLPEKEKFMISEREIKNMIAICLAGRTAEKIALGEITSGSENDLQKATELAQNFVCRFGMDPNVGLRSFSKTSISFLGPNSLPTRDFGPDTAKKIDDAIKNLLDEGQKKAESIITDHKNVLEVFCQELQKKEKLSRSDIERLISQKI